MVPRETAVSRIMMMNEIDIFMNQCAESSSLLFGNKGIKSTYR